MLISSRRARFQKHLHTLAKIAKLLHNKDFRQASKPARRRGHGQNHPRPLGIAVSLRALPTDRRAFQAAVSAVLPERMSVSSGPALPRPEVRRLPVQRLMALARERKMNPRKLAEEVAAKLDARDWCESVEIAAQVFKLSPRPAAVAP